MATLIGVYGSEGECMGRCDSKCYDAKHPHCDCVCGGANHGVGLNQATQNTHELADEWLEAYAADHPFERSAVLPKPVQMDLFAFAGVA